MPQTTDRIRNTSGYRFVDEGPRLQEPTVVLLHGMMGDLSNWSDTVHELAVNNYRVLVPVLPVYDMPLNSTSVISLVEFVHGFIETLQLNPAILVGNSLGGHIAILYTLAHPDAVSAMVLSGSSGIYEVSMGSSVPRRRDRAFIRDRAAVTFFDPNHVTDELVEELVEVLDNRACVARLIKMARSARDEVVTDSLHSITAPTLLVWGRNDRITPPEVAETLYSLLPNAVLHYIDNCGHAPMIEHPRTFNQIMLDFLSVQLRKQSVNNRRQSRR